MYEYIASLFPWHMQYENYKSKNTHVKSNYIPNIYLIKLLIINILDGFMWILFYANLFSYFVVCYTFYSTFWDNVEIVVFKWIMNNILEVKHFKLNRGNRKYQIYIFRKFVFDLLFTHILYSLPHIFLVSYYNLFEKLYSFI